MSHRTLLPGRSYRFLYPSINFSCLISGKQLFKTEGAEYADHFQFSLLEVCDLNPLNDVTIFKRESHWKTVFRTRELGLNSN